MTPLYTTVLLDFSLHYLVFLSYCIHGQIRIETYMDAQHNSLREVKTTVQSLLQTLYLLSRGIHFLGDGFKKRVQKNNA